MGKGERCVKCSDFMQSLDAWTDGELSEEQSAEMERHANQCAPCREQWTAAEQLRSFLSRMDEEISVPLPAQAGWRSAIRAEARRRRMKRIYGAVSAVAAAAVVAFCVTALLPGRQKADPAPETTGVEYAVLQSAPRAYVEADGLSEEAQLEASAAPVGLDAGLEVERRILADDVDTAYGYVMDIAAEYGATVEREAEDTAGKKVYLLVPGENLTDFVSAVEHVGTPADESAAVDAADGTVSVCVVIAQNN